MSEFRFEGGAEMERNLMRLPQATSKRVGRFALRKAAKPIAEMAKASAPDDPTTGAPDLKSSIKIASTRQVGRGRSSRFVDGNQIEMHVGPSSDGYPQALFQEFGTKRHGAQPYMRPAWDKEGGLTAMERISQHLSQAIKRAVAHMNKG